MLEIIYTVNVTVILLHIISIIIFYQWSWVSSNSLKIYIPTCIYLYVTIYSIRPYSWYIYIYLHYKILLYTVKSCLHTMTTLVHAEPVRGPTNTIRAYSSRYYILFYTTHTQTSHTIIYIYIGSHVYCVYSHSYTYYYIFIIHNI